MYKHFRRGVNYTDFKISFSFSCSQSSKTAPCSSLQAGSTLENFWQIKLDSHFVSSLYLHRKRMHLVTLSFHVSCVYWLLKLSQLETERVCLKTLPKINTENDT